MGAAHQLERRPREPKPIAGRVPPHALEAEAAVLSSLLIRPSGLDEVHQILRADHFYSPANGQIFEAICGVVGENKPLDSIQVATWLRSREQLERVGGLAYLAQIIDATPAVSNVEEHARIVVRKARMRRLIAEAQVIAAEGYGDVGDEDEWVESAEQRLARVAESSDIREVETIGTALLRHWTTWQGEIDGKVAPVGARFGVRALDEMMWPLRTRRVTLVGGFPGDGKTALALEAAIATAMEVRPDPSAVLFISAEMGGEELAQRALFSAASVDSDKARPGRHKSITDAEWQALTQAGSHIRDVSVFIDDRADISVDEIAPSVRRHKAIATRLGRTLRLVVIDYLQLIGPPTGTGRRNRNRENEVAEVSRGMKRIAKALDVHVLALAQLNDDSSKRKEDKRPSSKDYRESKAIWANADNSVLIYNPNVRERAKARAQGLAVHATAPEDVELIIDKQRGGRTGTVNATFLPQFTRFE